MPTLEAAEQVGMQVIWDLFHYGSPDRIDQAAPDFPDRFTDFALAAIDIQQSVSGRPPLVCPLNEINFLSWAVDDGYFPRVGPKHAAGSRISWSGPRSPRREQSRNAGRTPRSSGPSR